MLELVPTSDGSKTIFNTEVGENYHSKHGALQESIHVFLNSGLKYFLDGKQVKQITLLEVGFGTGLNFLLSADFCFSQNLPLSYTGIEAFPLDDKLIGQTSYNEYISADVWNSFLLNYPLSFNQYAEINHQCKLKTACVKLLHFKSEEKFDIIYFDAFAVIHQPEMWSEEALNQVCQYLKPGGVFVTYAITGNLKRSMKALGFSIEKVPGAAGKREMLRAVKLN